MAKIEWDGVGEREFEAGLDRGVLYIPEGIAWNGLIAVEEGFDGESKPYFLDGVKYMDSESLGDFQAKLTAFTYPDEFEPFGNGVGQFGNGLFIQNQRPKKFGLSYRTRIGNDLDGADHGYKIHIVYNAMAVPENKTYNSVGETPDPLTFGWSLTTTPELVEGHRPTAHVILDSTELDPDLLRGLEETLYGSAYVDPYLPSLAELIGLLETWATITITDNGDGTWTATTIGPDDNIIVSDDGSFLIKNVDATYLDDDTYTVRTTTADY